SSNSQFYVAAVPVHNTALFGYASYKLTDDIKASIQLNFGSNYGKIDKHTKHGKSAVFNSKLKTRR
ncbi:MAG: hypothetical protein V4506_05915, partial [Bacteroidota bacterium]